MTDVDFSGTLKKGTVGAWVTWHPSHLALGMIGEGKMAIAVHEYGNISEVSLFPGTVLVKRIGFEGILSLKNVAATKARSSLPQGRLPPKPPRKAALAQLIAEKSPRGHKEGHRRSGNKLLYNDEKAAHEAIKKSGADTSAQLAAEKAAHEKTKKERRRRLSPARHQEVCPRGHKEGRWIRRQAVQRRKVCPRGHKEGSDRWQQAASRREGCPRQDEEGRCGRKQPIHGRKASPRGDQEGLYFIKQFPDEGAHEATKKVATNARSSYEKSAHEKTKKASSRSSTVQHGEVFPRQHPEGGRKGQHSVKLLEKELADLKAKFAADPTGGRSGGLLPVLLHSADISNNSKPINSRNWLDRVFEEFLKEVCRDRRRF